MFIEIFLSVVMDATMQNMKKLPVRSACMKIPKGMTHHKIKNVT